MTITRFFMFVLCPICALGCQKYAPAPLDLGHHRRSLESRDPASPQVVDYARRLAQVPATQPAVYDPADGLSLREAEVVALFFNPSLRTARLRARIPLVGAAEAGRWEDPELQVDAERIVDSAPHPWVLGGLVNLTIPLSGRLKAEKEKANAEARVEELRVLAEERKLLAELRASWLEWSATIEETSLARALLEELDAFVEKSEKLRAAGELDPLDARLFRIERLTQAGRLQQLEAQARSEEMELKSRIGLTPRAGITLTPSLVLQPLQFPSTQDSALRVESHPRIRAARAEYAVAERALQLEIRRQYPDLAVGGGYGSDESVERVLGGLSLPLPLWNRNRRAIAEVRAAREAARSSAEGEYEQLLAEAATARAALDAASVRLKFVETELAPLVDEQLAAARNLGRLGNYNTLVLLEALKAAFDAKSEVLQARLKLALATARLGDLIDPMDTEATAGKDIQP